MHELKPIKYLSIDGHWCGDTTTRGCLDISSGVDLRKPAECTIHPGLLNVTKIYIVYNNIELQYVKLVNNPSIIFEFVLSFDLISFVGDEDCVDVLLVELPDEDPVVVFVFVATLGDMRDAILPNIPPSASTDDLLLGSWNADIWEEKNPEIDCT